MFTARQNRNVVMMNDDISNRDKKAAALFRQTVQPVNTEYQNHSCSYTQNYNSQEVLLNTGTNHTWPYSQKTMKGMHLRADSKYSDSNRSIFSENFHMDNMTTVDKMREMGKLVMKESVTAMSKGNSWNEIAMNVASNMARDSLSKTSKNVLHEALEEALREQDDLDINLNVLTDHVWQILSQAHLHDKHDGKKKKIQRGLAPGFTKPKWLYDDSMEGKSTTNTLGPYSPTMRSLEEPIE